jgi:hypothetical protein
MTKPRFFLNLSLLALLLASCAPAAVTELPAQPAAIVPSVTPAVNLTATYNLELSSATPAMETPLPIATSRGPNLEATDPVTVNLASGGLQFVEFFRFT